MRAFPFHLLLSSIEPQTPQEEGKGAAIRGLRQCVASDPPFNRSRYLATSKNSPELIAQHLKATGGKIRCRFPPEPNGYLHIGHAKSMYLNFKGAFERVGKWARGGGVRAREGETVLRFDDTNPEAEKLEFIDNIKEDVAWLGWKPCQVNFGSDNFDKVGVA